MSKGMSKYVKCPQCGRDAMPNIIHVGCVNTLCRNFSLSAFEEWQNDNRPVSTEDTNPFGDWEDTIPVWRTKD